MEWQPDSNDGLNGTPSSQECVGIISRTSISRFRLWDLSEGHLDAIFQGVSNAKDPQLLILGGSLLLVYIRIHKKIVCVRHQNDRKSSSQRTDPIGIP